MCEACVCVCRDRPLFQLSQSHATLAGRRGTTQTQNMAPTHSLTKRHGFIQLVAFTQHHITSASTDRVTSRSTTASSI